MRGLAVAGLACGGLTGIAADLGGEWRNPDPSELRIQHAEVGADGRHAFVGARHRHLSWPPILLIVDLEKGSARRVQSTLFARRLQHLGSNGWIGSNPELVFYEVGDPEQGMIRIVDSRTLEVLAENHYRQPYRGLEKRCRKSLRTESQIVLPDGRRVWVFDRALEIDDGDGHRTLLDKTETRELGHFCATGFGAVGTGRGEGRGTGWNVAYDFLREVRFDIPAAWSMRGCLAEGWLVSIKRTNHGGIARSRGDSDWSLYDPQARTARRPEGMRDGDRVIRVTATGKVLVSASDGLFRVDVGRGARDSLEPSWSDSTTTRGYFGPTYTGTTSTGRDVFRVHSNGRFHVTTLGIDSRKFTPLVLADRFVGATSDTTLITLADDGALERVDVETGSRERLFPKPAMR